MEINKILVAIRKELNLTQEELAHAVHVSFSTVNRWENKKAVPNRMARVILLDFCEKRNVNDEIIKNLRSSK